MTYQSKRCDTLLIPTGPTGDHLFAIATDVCANGSHLLLNVSTIYDGVFHDPTCEIEIGEHPFVVRRSYVAYQYAQIQSSARLAQMVAGWVYKIHKPASQELTDKMLAGVTDSPFTPRYVKKYLAS